MSRWIRVAGLEDCPPGACLEAVAEDRLVALFNVDGTLYALDGVCPHQGGPLGHGRLEGTTITCPWHGWQFDVRDGQHLLSQTIRQPRLNVRVEQAGVYVELEGGDDAAADASSPDSAQRKL